MGGFYSAEDADSLPTETDTHKKEGAFCVWEEGELRALLTDSITNTAGESVALADVFIKHYGVESAGNVKPHQVAAFFVPVDCNNREILGKCGVG